MRQSLAPVALVALLAAGCECGGGGEAPCTSNGDCAAGQACRDGRCSPMDARDAGLDAQAPVVDACALACGSTCCAPAQRCFRDECIPDLGSCGSAEPCLGDSACVDRVCVPWGTAPLGDHDPTCRREPSPLASFDPEIQCEWPGAHTIVDPTSRSVRVPPLIGDLDGDGVPEIVFSTWNAGSPPYLPRIRAIRGDDCSPVWTSDYNVDLNAQMALADLDGDGRPEICGRGSRYDLVTYPFCLRHDGALAWEGRDAAGSRVTVAEPHHDVGINIANVDGIDGPEVVFGLDVFDGVSGERIRSGPALRGLTSWPGVMPALADVDGDGAVEALTGGRVHDLVSGATADWGLSDGFAALADLSDAHPGPEVVVVSYGESTIRIHALDGTELYSHAIPGGSGGPPTIADLDGDGQPEVSSAGRMFLTAFDLDCVGTDADPPDPARCVDPLARDGVMWSVPTHELSSGFTGSSVFDFEGDGAVEIVYADECWARVFDGASGRVKFSAPHESITGIEYPVVADVDGDFFTELVVPHETWSDRSPCPAEDPLMPGVFREPGRQYAGLTVYRDRTDRWAPSRPLWSQHTEHFDQRNDDGSVPLVETPSWTTHNSYRRALPRTGGTAIDTPDLTIGSVTGAPCDEAAASQPLSARVCNRGTLPVGPGVRVSFRIGAADGTEACSAVTSAALEPGACETVSCVWSGVALSEVHEVHATIDPDDAIRECVEDNDRGVGRVRCPPGVF